MLEAINPEGRYKNENRLYRAALHGERNLPFVRMRTFCRTRNSTRTRVPTVRALPQSSDVDVGEDNSYEIIPNPHFAPTFITGSAIFNEPVMSFCKLD